MPDRARIQEYYAIAAAPGARCCVLRGVAGRALLLAGLLMGGVATTTGAQSVAVTASVTVVESLDVRLEPVPEEWELAVAPGASEVGGALAGLVTHRGRATRSLEIHDGSWFPDSDGACAAGKGDGSGRIGIGSTGPGGGVFEDAGTLARSEVTSAIRRTQVNRPAAAIPACESTVAIVVTLTAQ
jgi:hypothetical protein